MAGASPESGGTKKRRRGRRVLAAPYTPKSRPVRSRTDQAHVKLSTRRAKPNRGDNPCQYRLSAGQVVTDGGDGADRAPKPGARPLGSSLDLADVGGLETLGAPAHLELDLVALGQALEA